MGSHESASTGTDVWLTPRHVLDALGSFDLDPCAAPVESGWLTADKHYRLPDDGMRLPWQGRVWCNPPYLNVWAWLARLADHGSGTALIFARAPRQPGSFAPCGDRRQHCYSSTGGLPSTAQTVGLVPGIAGRRRCSSHTGRTTPIACRDADCRAPTCRHGRP